MPSCVKNQKKGLWITLDIYSILLFMYIVSMRHYKIITLTVHIFMPLGQAPGSKWERYKQDFLGILICLSAHTLE